MSDAALEALLATIYVDADVRARFFADPQGTALAAGLSAEQASMLSEIDRAGLLLTADCLAAKRGRKRRGWLERMIATLWR